jgi:hypothetical protein
MNTLLIVAALGLLYFAITKGWIKLDGSQVGQLARTMGGFALIGTAISLIMTGKILFGLPMGLVGLWLLGYLKIPGFKNFSAQGTGQRSAMLDIAIDPASGRIGGTIIAGTFAGRALDSLTKHECLILLRELQAADQTGLRLFAVYLDGRFPGWREDLQGGPDAGTGRQARPGVMPDKEAYQILGLAPGAGEPAIRDAHRRLMLKLHPDVGGSDTLAALVNEAKDVLLRRHR